MWVKSGVPQGSVLGPLLFIIMLFDIDKDVKFSLIGSYADDTRLWRFIHGEGDQALLQQDLQALYDWAEENNKTFNGDKFEHLPFGDPGTRVYTTPSGLAIKKKDKVKDLGVFMASDCSFDYHISTITKSASRVSGWIMRTFLSRDKSNMKVLLQSLLVPCCEYASIVWSPFDNKNINMIENIQRRFTSRIREYQTWDEELDTWICNVSYTDRLKDLRIYSLERRRERILILYAYRVLIGLVKFPWFEAYEDHEENGIKLKRKYNQRAPAKVRRIRHSSLFYKGAQLYNLLPSELRQFEEIVTPHQSHVNAYKERLDKFLELVLDEPSAGRTGRVVTTNSLICQIPTFRRKQQQQAQ